MGPYLGFGPSFISSGLLHDKHFSPSLKSFANQPIILLAARNSKGFPRTAPTPGDPGPSGESPVAPGTAIQSAHGRAAAPYEGRRPDETTLYRVVQKLVETFFAQVELETGAGLPQFVKDEFEAFLECGILAHEFLRLRWGGCAQDTLVAFSCKRRGFCPACGARRMAETAAHLVDHVIPHVPVRQWVVSFPIPLRHLFAAHLQFEI